MWGGKPLVVDWFCRNLKWMWLFWFTVKFLCHHRRQICFFHFSPNRETNLKVRQALTVTSDLGDITKLMDFDGEMMLMIYFHLWTPAEGFLHMDMLTCDTLQNDYLHFVVWMHLFRFSPAVMTRVRKDCKFCFVPQEKSFVSHQTTSWINLQELCTGETISTLWIMKKCCCEVVYSETLSGVLEWSSLLVCYFIYSPHPLVCVLFLLFLRSLFPSHRVANQTDAELRKDYI